MYNHYFVNWFTLCNILFAYNLWCTNSTRLLLVSINCERNISLVKTMHSTQVLVRKFLQNTHVIPAVIHAIQLKYGLLLAEYLAVCFSTCSRASLELT